MLSRKDLNSELRELRVIIESEELLSEAEYLRLLIKTQTLILKMLLSMRTNQVIDLEKKYGKEALEKPYKTKNKE